MPRHCCVPGCVSNYDRVLKSAGPVSTFSFPRDEDKKQEWLQAINRKDFIPTAYSAVCCEHFTPNDFQLAECGPPSKRPKLRKEAVPSIFPEPAPKNGTDTVKPRRKNASAQIFKQDALNKEIEQEISHSDCIASFEEFKNNFNEKLNLDKWYVFQNERKVVFFLTDPSEPTGCQFSIRIIIFESLNIKVFVKDSEVPIDALSWILHGNSKIYFWSQINNLLIRYRYERDLPSRTREYLEKASFFLKKACECGENFEDVGKLEILCNQFNLLVNKKHKYNPATVVMAFILRRISINAYEVIKRFITLPSEPYLSNIASPNNQKSENTTNTFNERHHLHYIARHLTEHDKYVALLIDEIYIEKGIDVKASHLSVDCKTSNVHGKNSSEKAHNVFVFMVKSMFSTIKEIVRLVPVVDSNDENELVSIVNDVVGFVQKLGFRIIVIISKNINMPLYRRLRSAYGFYFANPDFAGETIYLLFDTCNILKTVRNEWLHLSNIGQTFYYPDFETGEVKKASFQHLETLYMDEMPLSARKAYKLNYKTILPNSTEKNDIRLVENIFHSSTIAALTDSGVETLETAEFCEIFKKWWDIVNFKEIPKKHELSSKAFCNSRDVKLDFLEKFITWNDLWNVSAHNCNNGVLSKDTFEAIRITTRNLIDVVKYSLNGLKMKYVLPGRFQTDDLEGRFQMYRPLISRVVDSELEEDEDEHADDAGGVSDVKHQLQEQQKVVKLKNVMTLKGTVVESILLENPSLEEAVLEQIEREDSGQSIDINNRKWENT